jgi:hypothetical protein
LSARYTAFQRATAGIARAPPAIRSGFTRAASSLAEIVSTVSIGSLPTAAAYPVII